MATTSIGSGINTDRVNMRSILWAGPAAIVAATIVNLFIREIGVAVGAVPTDLFLLQPAGIIGSTIVQTLAAVIVFALVARFSSRPVWLYTRIAAAALLLSYVPLIALGSGVMQMGVTVSGATLAVMAVMHLVSAVTVVGLLVTLTRER